MSTKFFTKIVEELEEEKKKESSRGFREIFEAVREELKNELELVINSVDQLGEEDFKIKGLLDEKLASTSQGATAECLSEHQMSRTELVGIITLYKVLKWDLLRKRSQFTLASF